MVHLAASSLMPTAVFNHTSTNLDALRGLKQLEFMRDTLRHIHKRYTAWVRLQQKPPLDRTVREDLYEKSVRTLIAKGQSSLRTISVEVNRHSTFTCLLL